MRYLILLLACFVMPAMAENVIYGSNISGPVPIGVNTVGQPSITLLAGEDQTNNVMRVEEQFSVCVDDADIVCKATAGFVHSINCWPEDAATAAGRVRLLNHTAAGGGVEVWGTEFAAAAYAPQGAILDIVMSAGVVIDFTDTTDAFCTVSYR